MPKKIYKGWKNYTEPARYFHTDEEYSVPKNTWLEDSFYLCPKNKRMPSYNNIPASEGLYDSYYEKKHKERPRSKAADEYEKVFWKDSSMETRSETKLREQTLQVLERKLI